MCAASAGDCAASNRTEQFGARAPAGHFVVVRRPDQRTAPETESARKTRCERLLGGRARGRNARRKQTPQLSVPADRIGWCVNLEATSDLRLRVKRLN